MRGDFNAFSHLIVPIAFFILLILFLCQRFGTGKIGFSFGPIILIWFIIIGILGLVAIIHNPVVIKAINPYYAYEFFRLNHWTGFILLSGVFLIITGAEAMYADLGHFGRRAIRLSWFSVVLPALLLNYFGQGAYLLQNHAAINHLFYALAPSWFAFPLLILATLATIIASQAVISASFSLAKQAILLNVCPRLSIVHTSKGEKGQVYVPQINFILGVGTLLLVIIFRSSSALASAYGMAVNLVMIIVAILVMFVAHLIWYWSIAKIVRIFFIFTLFDLTFLVANFHKILEGAWIPLLFALLSGIIMITWDKGLKVLRSSYYKGEKEFPDNLKRIEKSKLTCLVDMMAIFIADPYDESGSGFLRYLQLNRVMPKHILIISVMVENYPYVAQKDRYELIKLDESMYRLILHYGFMQSINIPRSLKFARKKHVFPFPCDLEEASFLVELINISITNRKFPHLFYWQKKLFAFLLRNSALDSDFFHLPYDRTVTIGTYFEM